MPWLIEKPAVIRAAGTRPKAIEEFVGHVNTGHRQVSVARMLSPEGWSEPAQCPQFMEITVVLRGCLVVRQACRSTRVGAGQAVITQAGETVAYETPDPGGAEYLAVCLPAFSPETVNRSGDAHAARSEPGRERGASGSTTTTGACETAKSSASS